jgi:threonine 3-dehydrogenase
MNSPARSSSHGPQCHRLAIGQRCSGEGHLIGKTSRASRAGKFHLDPEPAASA